MEIVRAAHDKSIARGSPSKALDGVPTPDLHNSVGQTSMAVWTTPVATDRVPLSLTYRKNVALSDIPRPLLRPRIRVAHRFGLAC
jgi:hypothetical protein